MRRLLEPFKPHIAVSFICAAISVCASLLVPVFVGRSIDCMAGAQDVDFKRLYYYLGIIGALVICAFVSQYVMGLANTVIQTRIVKTLRGDAFASLVQLPLKVADETAHGDLESRIITDADAVGDGLLLGMSQLFTGVLTIAGTIFFLFAISPVIAPVVVVLTPLSLFVAGFISKKSRAFFEKQAALRGEVTGFCDERIRLQRLIKSYGASENEKKEFLAKNEELSGASLRATFYSSLPNPSSRFVNNIIYAAVGVIGAYVCMQGHITVGTLTSFLAYATGYAKPFNEITGVITELQNALVCRDRLLELIDMPAEDESSRLVTESVSEKDNALAEREAVVPAAKIKGDILFDEVAFSYSKDTPLIENLSLDIKRGDHVAITGPTGAGKTTLVNLLMRFYDMDSGRIMIDGSDIVATSRRALRKSFGMVLQETWLREGTVLDNIRLGKKDATEDEVREAAILTRAHDFIRLLPEGYHTMLTSEGGVLSQGQKQLLCITRIMLSLPPMLILDEATSSIDTRTEMKISDAFTRMMEGRTTFIVAHRLATVRNSDLILYMEHGTVKEKGTHEELMELGGAYSKLYLQSCIGQKIRIL